jgi:hypothetical protein
MCIPYQVYRQAVVWMLASYKPRSAADGSYFLALAKSSFLRVVGGYALGRSAFGCLQGTLCSGSNTR